jgi:hypothetical protein
MFENSEKKERYDGLRTKEEIVGYVNNFLKKNTEKKDEN